LAAAISSAIAACRRELREAERVIDAVCFAPRHQRLVGKAAVGAQDDANARPAPADLRDHARHLFDRAVATCDVRLPLPRQQQMPTAEHVERQIAVLVVVAVEEAAFLHAEERNVGVVEIEHDLARRTLVRLEEKIDEKRVDPRSVAVDLVILRAMALGRVLETIERALARQGFAVRP
jgi:hypothetical protein